MTRKEIENLNNQIITEGQLDEIEINEEVTNVECLGQSGYAAGYYWYIVEFTDAESIDVYFK